MSIFPELEALRVLEEAIILVQLTTVVADGPSECRTMSHLAAMSLISHSQLCKQTICEMSTYLRKDLTIGVLGGLGGSDPP